MVEMNSMDFYRHSPSTAGMVSVCVSTRTQERCRGLEKCGTWHTISDTGKGCPSFTGIELIFFSVAGPEVWFGFRTGIMLTTQGCFGCC